MLGGTGTTPPSDSPGNVPPSCSLGMERGRTNDPPRLLAWPSTLDTQADISVVQLVGYQTTREEIRDLCHQVYKLRRLPGSLQCRPEQVHELTRDVVSSLKNHLRQRVVEQPRGHEEPEPADTHPSWDKTSQRMRWGTSAEREPAEAREAHWQVLVATAALEERIEVEPVHH